MAHQPVKPNAEVERNREDQRHLDRLAAARNIVDRYQSSSPTQVESFACQAEGPVGNPPEEGTGKAGEEVSEKALYLKAREAAVRYIGLDKGKSSGKVRDSLIQKGYAPSLAHAVVQDLIGLGYVNDENACAKIARRHQGKKSKSRSYMLSLFIQQGVERGVAEAYVDQLPCDAKSLQEVLEGHPLDLDGGRQEARLMRRLQTRGYNYGLIKTSIRRFKEANAQ